MIEEALSFVDPTDRDTWVRMAMAVHSELGGAGFEVWDAWSQGAASYDAGAARSVWRSLGSGDVSIGSLYFEAREAGWSGSGCTRRTRSVRHNGRDDQALKHEAARVKAQAMLDVSIRAPHDYLARKGFPKELALCSKGLLLVPMRDHRTNRLNSIQTIGGDGTKLFLAGGKASGSVFRMGNGVCPWLVEGFATGLSVRAALRSMYCNDPVVVCFSASNLAKVPGAFVIADHDESRIGEKAAKKTGLPWWMPPIIGDANDFHLAYSLDALADSIRKLRLQRH